jgi:protein-S-isoprenylcysteine O-methyltransferase Ste14
MYLFFTGIFLLYPNLFFLVFTSGAVAGIHIQILNEEKFLRDYYGKAYIDYSERVGRYF